MNACIKERKNVVCIYRERKYGSIHECVLLYVRST